MIHAVLRPAKVKPSTDPDIVANLPHDLWWPDCDLAASAAMIDAVYAADCRSLEEWQALYPDHGFGFADFLKWAKQHYHRKTIITPPAPPKGSVTQRLKVHATTWRGLPVIFTALSYCTDDSRVEFKIGPTTDPLSIFLLDPASKNLTPLLHKPSRYRALGINPQLLKEVLGHPPPSRPYLRPAAPSRLPAPVI